MVVKWIFLFLFLVSFLIVDGQENTKIRFQEVSVAEKWWVIKHPFVAKKAIRISVEARLATKEIIESKILKGVGSGDQVDAFRHAFWMARLTQEIGGRKANSLGKAHEKGNYRQYKKRRKEDGSLPDKISSEMDFYNNAVGVRLGEKTSFLGLKEIIVETVLKGNCKIIKKDRQGNFLDCDGNIIEEEGLVGRWENLKCLVDSNYLE